MSCLDRTRAGELFELYEEDVIRKELYPIFVKLARHVPRISRCRAGDPVADNLVRDERYATREAIHHARRAGDPVADNLVRDERYGTREAIHHARRAGTLWRTISQRLCGAAPLKE